MTSAVESEMTSRVTLALYCLRPGCLSSLTSACISHWEIQL